VQDTSPAELQKQGRTSKDAADQLHAKSSPTVEAQIQPDNAPHIDQDTRQEQQQQETHMADDGHAGNECPCRQCQDAYKMLACQLQQAYHSRHQAHSTERQYQL
jgi:hypothetical protein